MGVVQWILRLYYENRWYSWIHWRTYGGKITRIPKYIDEALRKRTKAANAFNKYDIIISQWIDEKGLSEDVDSSCFHGGVESVVHPGLKSDIQ